MSKKKQASEETAGAIVAEAVRIACATGIGGVTARAVAGGIGIAPSAVIYYFKTIAGLLNAVHGAAGVTLAEWRQGVLRALEDPAARLLSTGALVAATVTALTRELGPLVILQQELRRAALRGLLPLDEPPAIAIEARTAFWQTLLQHHDTAPDRIATRRLIAEGLVPFALLDPVAFRRDALISAVIARLEDRLARRAVLARVPDPELPEVDQAPSLPQGKRRIIDAAMRIIGREGLANLTHRKVAAEAEVSLAATTYFYASKEDLIADAFQEIQRRAVHAVVQARQPRQQFIASVLLDEKDEERWEIAAMLALNHAAIRFPRFESLALTLRQVRGIDAMRWLRAQGFADADHLDGILWSAATTPIGEYALRLPPAERRAYLDEETERVFSAMFGDR